MRLLLLFIHRFLLTLCDLRRIWLCRARRAQQRHTEGQNNLLCLLGRFVKLFKLAVISIFNMLTSAKS